MSAILLEEELVTLLKEKGYTVTTAESCTGGLVSGTIVNTAGASDVLNEAKEKLLGVSHETLEKYGAVSAQTAKEMAEGAAKAAGANMGLSTTGIAGPGGGTKEKPVGLVYVGCSLNQKTETIECRFSGDRQENRRQAVERVLSLAIEMLKS